MPTLKIRRQPTRAQLVILQKVIDGRSQKQIAFELGKSLTTVKKHLAAARARAGVPTLYQLVAVAILVGWCKVDICAADRAPLVIVSPRIE